MPPGARDESSSSHGGPGRHEDHCDHGAHGGPCPPGARDESSPSHGGPGRHDDNGDHGAHGDPSPPGRVTKARRVTAVTAGTMITAVTAEAMRIPTITAVTAGPCPPSERHAVAWPRRSRRSRCEPASQRIGDPKLVWPGSSLSATHYHFHTGRAGGQNKEATDEAQSPRRMG
jgi:hypothetical protein